MLKGRSVIATCLLQLFFWRELLFYADNLFLLDITCRDETLFKHSRVKVVRFTKYTLHILKQVKGALWFFWGGNDVDLRREDI